MSEEKRTSSALQRKAWNTKILLLQHSPNLRKLSVELIIFPETDGIFKHWHKYWQGPLTSERWLFMYLKAVHSRCFAWSGPSSLWNGDGVGKAALAKSELQLLCHSRECHTCGSQSGRFCRPVVSTPKSISSQGFAYTASMQLVCENAAFKCLFPKKGIAEFRQPVPSASLEWYCWSKAGNICNSSWQR